MTPSALYRAAADCATRGIPVLPLRAGKRPLGNCTGCRGSRCGDRPHMSAAGPCRCPRPCHGWAAATTDSAVLSSQQWAPAWRQAAALAYHPAGAGVTVVDLDTADAVAWARATLPATATVPTSRGEHWIYQGTMPSANRVRPGVDIKSRMSYARWLGHGTGTLTPLPDAVRHLAQREETTGVSRPPVVSSPAQWDRQVATGCRHTERYVRTGLNAGLAKVRACRDQGAGSQAYGVARFLAARHTGCPGPCGLDELAAEVTAAAVAVGVPQGYAARAVTRGMAGVL